MCSGLFSTVQPARMLTYWKAKSSSPVQLLEEYFYSQREYLAELLSPFQTDLDREIRDGDESFEFARLTEDDLLTGLVRIAERT